MFVIQSLPRCGTHMLRSALNSHGDLWCYHEVFNPDMQSTRTPDMPPLGIRDVAEVIAHCQSQQRPTGLVAHAYVGLAADETGVGLDPAYRSCRHVQIGRGLWRAIPPNTPVVTLWRQNLLARYVSALIAQRRNLWQVKRGGPVPPPIRVKVDCQAMLTDFARTESLMAVARDRFPEALRVSYEQLVSETDAVLAAVQSHIQVEVKTLTPGTVKVGRPLSASVTNIEEVRSVLRGTSYETFLERAS